MLVRVVATREPLLGRVAGDPDMLRGETCPPVDGTAGIGEQRRRRHDHQLVARRLVDLVPDVGIDDLPEAPRGAIGLAGCIRLVLQQLQADLEDVSMRILRPHGHAHIVVLGHAVAGAVDRHVQARIEEMLVGGTAERGHDHAAPGISLALHEGGGLHDARQLGLELDGAVLVEVPVEAVVVVPDSGEEADDEAPRTARLADAGPEFIVLPEDAVVFLVHADGVAHDEGLAEIVRCRHVEIVDVPEAIAAEFELVRELAKAELARIEGAFGKMLRRRIGIGNRHLRYAGAMDDRAQPAAVAKAELVEDEPFPRREADAELPVLPGDVPAVDDEARPVGLDNLERLQIGARRRERSAVIIVLLPGNGHEPAVVLHGDDLALDQVDHRDHTLDRMSVGVVLLEGPVIGDGAQDPAPLVGLEIEIARRDRIDLDQVDLAVRQPAQNHGRAPALIRLDDVGRAVEILDDDRRLAVLVVGFQIGPGDEPLFAQVHQRLAGTAARDIEHQQEGDAGEWRPRHECRDFLPGRLLELDERKAWKLAQIARGAQDPAGGVDLADGQRIERMGRLQGRGGFVVLL